MTGGGEGFSRAIVSWQARHGRQGLPWQSIRDPYRVWLSEVMLQQTQVSTVLRYYEQFIRRFPTVHALAAAPEDDVMSQWSGLGYYSRARNLHQCAKVVVTRLGGEFPTSAHGLEELPGIGRSTAAAIASFCFNERVAILDGNVRRVISRVCAFDADLSVAKHQEDLWELATALLPGPRSAGNMPQYTQGLMDLGAIVCHRKNPACGSCPVRSVCAAALAGNPERYPVRTRRPRREVMVLWLLHARSPGGAVWLERRPSSGIWAGLYCFPVFSDQATLEGSLAPLWRKSMVEGTAFRHALTHREMHIHPVSIEVPESAFGSREGSWFLPEEWDRLGLPAPVKRMLIGT